MPNDTITLVSTTDSAEEVKAALTGKPAKAETPAVEPPAEPVKEPAKEVAPAEGTEAATETATETPEQKEERETKEASEAGSRLAKRRKSIQDEIDDMTRSKHAVRRDVEAEEARLQDLRRQRQELEGKPVEAKAAAEKKAATEGRTEPKLDAVDDKGDAKYATYEDYLSDHAVWTREEAVLAARKFIEEEKAADRDRIDRDSANRVATERLASYNTSLEAFKKTHADFDAAVEDAREAVQETLVAMGPQALKVIDGYTVFDAEDGPALAYYLLKRPDELKAIAMKAPHQQIVHLARLEERIRPASAKKTGPLLTAPETKAPQPIKPVGSGPTAATTVPLDEAEYQDYRARRERELRARRGA